MLPVPQIQLLLVIVISYLLGSFPTAYLVARRRNLDIFTLGSGNMGATNVIRAMGLGWGLAVWMLDSAKGILAIGIATLIMPDNRAVATVMAALVAIVGHNWSLFATMITGKLRGGKGAAIAFGTLLVIAPLQVILGMLALGGLIILLTRYVSLGVLAMFSLSAVWMFILIDQHLLPHEYTVYSLMMVALILYRHRENIYRLLTGTERRLGESAA
ncbi:MAG: glycerol-3-phosphate acyltransferase [Anaerolineae bacterium]|nr:glycerol-3-phosphate acyltransferase [Anaerolineae bacterium]